MTLRTPLLLIAALTLSVITLVLNVRISYAEESASSLAKKLESQILSSAEVVMSFKSATEGKVTVKADLKGKRVRLESANILILSDGKTIWNVSKKTNTATIDVVSAHSAFRDPSALFKFSENYLSQLSSHTGSTYTLELIPSKDLTDLFKQAGSDEHLQVVVKTTGKTLRVMGAKAISSTGRSVTGPVVLTQLKSTKSSDFEFHRAAGMKIIDLRE